MKKTLDKISELYTKNLKEYGCSSKSVGWRDDISHVIRFEKLSYLIDNCQFDSELSINDYGCGYGAMFKFLDALPSIKIGRYFGYDISSDMLSAANDYIDDDRVHWINSDHIIHQADFSIVSGTFNVKMESSDDAWKNFIIDVLHQMNDKSKIGFSFNLLTIYVDWKEEHLYYADPLFFFDYCKRNFSKYVTLFHDYPLYEWTISVLKEKA